MENMTFQYALPYKVQSRGITIIPKNLDFIYIKLKLVHDSNSYIVRQQIWKETLLDILGTGEDIQFLCACSFQRYFDGQIILCFTPFDFLYFQRHSDFLLADPKQRLRHQNVTLPGIGSYLYHGIKNYSSFFDWLLVLWHLWFDFLWSISITFNILFVNF